MVDMDAFYASIEERNDPSLVGKPVAVGSTERRGVVATANYVARKYGVGSAMPSYRAFELCPIIVFVKPNMAAYKEASDKIREVLESYSDNVEFASIDEAYLDVTENIRNISDDIELGDSIRKEIKEKIGVTASIGIGKNKFLAKIASDMQKPNGLTIIRNSEVDSILANLTIGKFIGIGKKTTPIMEAMGIMNGKDLRDLPIERLREIFGNKKAPWFYNICRGIDDRPVVSERALRKSISVSQTYQWNIKSDRVAYESIVSLIDELMVKMDMYGLYGRTITLKIKFSDFTINTRSKSGMRGFTSKKHILDICLKLLKAEPLVNQVRLFGITSSNLETKEFKF
jgi:DNA polymerase-4